MASSKYATRVFTVRFEDLVSLETRLPLQALSLNTLGPIKVGLLRVSHTAPAGCQMIVTSNGGEVKNDK
jgi:hypothetical protein